ncbi:hypothetical protein LG943_12135 [Streptomonospora sp. S1-112]|uniref:Uncharacterized protein n=1 Tax=Streptomonospora mangrovi TaxID=2883123 RepID=A0A9X3SEK3_9ACTN|nr:hypothetical protein [Streptomonospora mangrovi]MDA0565062.1 hypothetical protein [Streptomonospora mangrovi]
MGKDEDFVKKIQEDTARQVQQARESSEKDVADAKASTAEAEREARGR